MIWQAVQAGFGYFQREAGYTRTGSHGTRVHGRETGQWHEADLAVAHWLQHTSRDGDMQLHVHSQIAHVARTATDGKWRAPDSLGYNEHIGAVAAIVSQHLEEALTAPVRRGVGRAGRRPRVRDQGHQRGDDARCSPRAASRSPRICATARRGSSSGTARAPSQRELAQLAQASNFATRSAKHGALDFAQLHAGWADKLARTLGVSLASVAPSVWHAERPRGRARRATADARPGACRARADPRGAEGGRAGAAGEEHLDPRGPGQVPGPGAAPLPAWTRPRPPRCSRTWPTGRWPRSSSRSSAWKRPSRPRCRRSLLRADGRSVYQRHGGTRYATRAQLAMEERMLAQARAERRAAPDPRAGRARARRGPGAARGRAGRPRARHARRAGRARRHTQTGLREDQAAAALSVADRRQARVGDQRARRVRARPGCWPRSRGIWAEAGLGPVIGITAVPVRPQHPGRRGPGVLQQRAVPGPPARPARRPRPGPDRPGHAAGGR